MRRGEELRVERSVIGRGMSFHLVSQLKGWFVDIVVEHGAVRKTGEKKRKKKEKSRGARDDGRSKSSVPLRVVL